METILSMPLAYLATVPFVTVRPTQTLLRIDNMKWTLPSLPKLKKLGSPAFFAWSDAKEVRSIQFHELILLEPFHMLS